MLSGFRPAEFLCLLLLRRGVKSWFTFGRLTPLLESVILMFAALKHFFADVQGSRQGILVPEELFRSILTSLGSGTIIGVVVVILQAMLDHVVSIFPDPAIASLASISLTLILDLLRRQTHGDKPALVPASVPKTVPVAVPTATSDVVAA